jgi:hypothetical protein
LNVDVLLPVDRDLRKVVSMYMDEYRQSIPLSEVENRKKKIVYYKYVGCLY